MFSTFLEMRERREKEKERRKKKKKRQAGGKCPKSLNFRSVLNIQTKELLKSSKNISKFSLNKNIPI